MVPICVQGQSQKLKWVSETCIFQNTIFRKILHMQTISSGPTHETTDYGPEINMQGKTKPLA